MIMGKDFIKTEAQIYIDGKTVANFFTDEVQVLRTGEANSDKVLKRYEFESEIELTAKQAWRFIRILKKRNRQFLFQQWKWQFSLKMQKLFKVVTHLFKVGK